MRRSPTHLSLLQEQRYRRRFLREDGRQTAIVTAVIAAAIVLTTFNEVLLLRGSRLLFVALALRALLAASLGVSIFLLRRARRPKEQDRGFCVGLSATAICLPAIGVTRILVGQIQAPLLSLSVFTVFLYFAQRGPVGPRAVTGGLIMVTALAVSIAGPPGILTLSTPVLVASAIGLLTLNVIGITSARAFEDQRRKRFDAERLERLARHELAARLHELALAKDRAESMLRARAAFLAAMSHELRTPMNAVIGLSDLLLDSPLPPADAAHVRTISESAHALLRLLNDVLDFAKIDAQKLALSAAPFDLRRLAESVIEMLRPIAAGKSLDLALDLSPDEPLHLVGDDARLRQVLVNLAGNALKFTERGSVTLHVAASAQEASRREVVFRVEDTGIGMPPDVVARLFRPFEQADAETSRRYGGTGLGLAISKQIVVAMGGDIDVESAAGRGSVFSFTLRLPAAPAPVHTALATAAGARPPLAILVVDDNAINREVAQARIGRLGYEVELASSGREAVLAVSSKDYDVVFMDLRMPEMSGVEATRQILEKRPGERAPHVIAMTASVFEEDREACRRAGMVDFVGKPIDLAQIDAVLGRVAQERGAKGVSEPKSASLAAKSPASAAKGTALAAKSIAALRDLAGDGDPELLASLHALFKSEGEKRLPRMREALGRGDARVIEAEAHALKSGSAALGAAGMSELCGQIEVAARAGQIDELHPVFDALQAEYLEAERALFQEITQPEC